VNLSRDEFVDLASDGPAVVRIATDLDVDVEPLAAYAALTGRTGDGAAAASRTGEDDVAGTDDVDETAINDGDRAADYGFLLESAEKVASSDPDGAFRPEEASRHARFSFVGYDPAAVVTVGAEETTVDVLDSRYADLVAPNGGDTVATLREALPNVERRGFRESTRQQLDGGLVGFLAYDAVYDLWLEEVGRERPGSRFPDAQFLLTTRTLAFDEANDALSLVFTPVVRPADDPGEIYDDLVAEAHRVEDLLRAADGVATGGFRRQREDAGPRDAYEAAVERATEHVLDGDVYQCVVSRTRELTGEVDPVGLYESLRAVNPSPYMYLLGYDDLTVVGASPETLVSVRGEEVMANPIAGTCDRGSSPAEDRRLAGEMLADDKERAEHTMLVDLARNDVRRVAEPGSVRVDEFMNVRKYSHVQHIESTVTGRLADDRDAFDATRAAFPAGTLAGAPKIRAMEIIDDLEREPRGLYGGGVGYYSWNGDADFAIVIRTATVEREGDRDRITVRAGAGIVADSDPASEYRETERKMDGVLEAIERIDRDGGDGAKTASHEQESGTGDRETGSDDGPHGPEAEVPR
jgi:anthranilate synthase component 1